MKSLLIIATTALSFTFFAQDENIPYHEVPSHPEIFTAGSVAARMVDGLGSRYHE